MNKRWNDRRPVSLELVINYPALGLLRGKATNISNDGMFITTAAKSSLCSYCNIEITINLPELSDTPLQLQAVIIHGSFQGIGIMFKDHENSSTLELIQQYIAKTDNFYKQAS